MKGARATGYATFSTALGDVGVAWSALGVLRILLPGEGDEAAGNRLETLYGAELRRSALPAPIQPLVAAVQAHLSGAAATYDAIPLDLSDLSPFAVRVYEVARRIPVGRARTYGAVAAGLGKPGAARAVGAALSRNPFPLVVPCHRVVAADGSLGGFTAPGGADTKRRLLELERA